MTTKIPAAPAGTGPAGRRLWRSVVARFELDEHEMVLLRQAVQVVDSCARLQAIVEEQGEIVQDRFGQPKTNPALVELRSERALLARLIVALRVPIGDQETAGASTAPLARAQRRGPRGVYGIIPGGAS
jgi:hypothetical protein